MGWPWENDSNNIQAQKAQPKGSSGSTAKEGSLMQLLPNALSTFEFGPVVIPGGDVLRGVCTGENPNVIQACTWSLDKLEGAGKKPAYRIEF